MNTPSGVTVSSIKLGNTTVTKTGHWTYSSGTLTFKDAYLATLENGEQTFTVTMSNGDIISPKITVGA